MNAIDALKFAAATQGIPPEIIEGVAHFGEDFREFIVSGVELHRAQTLDARVSMLVKLSGVAGCEDLAGMLLEEVRTELTGETPDDDDGGGGGEPDSIMAMG